MGNSVNAIHIIGAAAAAVATCARRRRMASSAPAIAGSRAALSGIVLHAPPV